VVLYHFYVALSCHVLICDHWVTLLQYDSQFELYSVCVFVFYMSEQERKERDRLEFMHNLLVSGQTGWPEV